LRAAGACLHAVDQVMAGIVDNAFCAVRPPGHHAEPSRAMGFCLFNNVAIAALYARAKHGAERVAVVDFDVHHGNGTQAAFWSDKDLFYGSTHQMPLFPGTGAAHETGVGNICNAALSPGDGSEAFRYCFEERILPALNNFSTDFLLVSAGFDAHIKDPLAQIRLTEPDFAWVTEKLLESANKHCQGKLVSSLEGGYNLDALASSAAVHVDRLMAAAS
jgi:acetoin utilization deacetylase AcuC-like enzyme